MKEQNKTLYSTLKFYINGGVTITMGIIFFSLSFDKFNSLFQTDLLQGVLSIILSIVTLFWFFIYVHSNVSELEILNRNLDFSKIPSLGYRPVIMTVSITILFGVIISFSTNLLIYSLVIIVLEFFDIIGDATVQNYIFKAIKLNMKKDSDNKEIINIIYEYYFENPIIYRDILILIFYNISMILCLFGIFENLIILSYISHFVIIFTIIFGEIVIFQWRKKRDKKIYLLDNKYD